MLRKGVGADATMGNLKRVAHKEVTRRATQKSPART